MVGGGQQAVGTGLVMDDDGSQGWRFLRDRRSLGFWKGWRGEREGRQEEVYSANRRLAGDCRMAGGGGEGNGESRKWASEYPAAPAKEKNKNKNKIKIKKK